ncbi:MAG: hypothetical protein ACFFAH_03015 [Promethearchaeota archaeon]
MQNDKKLKNLICILILVFISSCFPITFINMFLGDIPFFSSLLKEYFTSGKSIFFPSLPYINILEFIPKEYQIIQFSMGQLIDIVIIFNFFCYLDTLFYHYVKSAFLNEEDRLLIYMGTYFLGTKGKFDAQYQDLDLIFGVKDELRYYLDDKRLDVIKRNSRKNERIDGFYITLERRRYRSISIINRIFHRESKLTLSYCYKNLVFSRYYALFEKFWIFRSKNPYPHPEINIFTDFYDYYQWEGIN